MIPAADAIRTTRHVWPDVPNSDEVDVFAVTENGIGPYEVRPKRRVIYILSELTDAIEKATKLAQPSEADYQNGIEVVDDPTPRPSNSRNSKRIST